jgi:hypothetical protein
MTAEHDTERDSATDGDDETQATVCRICERPLEQCEVYYATCWQCMAANESTDRNGIDR